MSSGCGVKGEAFTKESSSFGAHSPSVETFRSGDEIQVGWGRKGFVSCSVSYISHRTALTAGHCGKKYAKVFSKGKEIGWVSNNYLFSDTGVDIAEITLIDTYGYDVRVDSMVQQDIYSGMPLVVFTFLNGGRKGTLQDEKIGCQRFSIDGVSVIANVYTAELDTAPGSSGAPIYSEEGELIGIVQGGDGNGTTSFTPLTFLDPTNSSLDVSAVCAK